MPRNLTSQYITLFGKDAMFLATCVKIIRTDGVVIALTTADQSITDHDGITIYEPLGSISTSSLNQTADSGVDNMEAWGMLTSDLITEDDLRAGRYDNADVYVYLIDPSVNPIVTKLTLLRSKIGEISTANGKFTAELRSTTQLLKQQITNVTTPGCRVRRFGDSQCMPGGVTASGHTIADYTFNIVGSSQLDDFTIEVDLAVGVFWPVDLSGDIFNYGIMGFTSGANAGIEREIKSYSAPGLTTLRDFELRTPFPYSAASGDTGYVIQGCQRRFREDCIGLYDNAPNFHGEPEIPGNDTLIKTGRPPTA